MNTNKNRVIGSGQEGTVYKKTVAVKKSKNNLSFEYKINSLVYTADPKHIVHPLVITENHKNIYMNYINSKNLNNAGIDYIQLIKKVIQTLRKIHRKYPSFRHNDLHTKNIVINKLTNEPVILDFGFADMNECPNPKVRDGKWKDEWGIYHGNNKNYDVHFFLNSLYSGAKRNNNKQLCKIIEYLLPAEYLKPSSPVVHNFRLRSDVKHPNLPNWIK